MKTIYRKPKDFERKWYLIDAENVILGKVAVKTATLLRGKHKPFFMPNQEMGDYVVIINAEKVAVTGNKDEKKVYYHHSGFFGGIKAEVLGKVRVRKPEFPIEQAIKGMLPKGRLGRKLFNNVKVYAGANHPHAAQKPELITVN